MCEDLLWDYECNQIVQQPEHKAWAVWDAEYEREIPVMHCQWCKNRGPPTYFQNPKDLGKALAKGNVLTAPDIDIRWFADGGLGWAL
jgi:hypothetical protein